MWKENVFHLIKKEALGCKVRIMGEGVFVLSDVFMFFLGGYFNRLSYLGSFAKKKPAGFSCRLNYSEIIS